MGERLHKVLGQIDLGTLDSGERLLPFGLLVFKQNMLENEEKCKNRIFGTQNPPFNMCFIA